MHLKSRMRPSGLGCILGVYHVQTKPGIGPVVHAHRTGPVPLKDNTEAELKRMENLGVVNKQTEPTDW